jgi:hypothetical protein
MHWAELLDLAVPMVVLVEEAGVRIIQVGAALVTNTAPVADTLVVLMAAVAVPTIPVRTKTTKQVPIPEMDM